MSEDTILTIICVGFMYPALIVLIPVSLIGFETDMGTAALLTCASLIILLVGGGNIRFFLGSGICSLIVLGFECTCFTYPDEISCL